LYRDESTAGAQHGKTGGEKRWMKRRARRVRSKNGYENKDSFIKMQCTFAQ